MAQYIKAGNIFGRLGSGIGQGLAQQLPQEIERGRLQQGLQELNQQKNLSPFERFSGLVSLPGTTPQIVQSGADILNQEARNNAIAKVRSGDNQAKPNPFVERQKPENKMKESPSITTSQPIKATVENYIPPSYNQILDRAGQLFNENPGLYNNDAQNAIQAATTEANQEQSINQAYQTRRGNEQNVQNTVTGALRNQQQNLGADIVPGNVYSEIEDKAIQAVKPVSQGGEGLTEQEAMKKYGKELDQVARDYQAIDTIGGWSLLSKEPRENQRALNSLRTKFKSRNDLENFGDSLISKNGLSPGKAYRLAYPVSENKELNNSISRLKPLQKTVSYAKGYPETTVPQEYLADETLKISKQLASKLGKEGSPLAVAEEIAQYGYDPGVWLDYLSKNRRDLDLSARQERELDKPRNFVPTLDDLWMFGLSGLDKLVEQK